MGNHWIGAADVMFIPLVVEQTPGYEPPPPNFRGLVQRRVYFDPLAAPLAVGTAIVDRSLMAYFSAVSYGQAHLDAIVTEPVTLTGLADDENATLSAIRAQPKSHLHDYLAVVYPTNGRNEGYGMSNPGQIMYDPPRTPNRTRARSRFRHDESIGVWAMELLHNITGIGDFYNGPDNPGEYDEMAGVTATHPCAYTKLLAGWLDPGTVPLHTDDSRTYSLHAISLPHPAPGGRVAAVMVQAPGSNRYLLIEARLRTDVWDSGIPAEGVIVYEFAPEDDPWPRTDPNGPWPPLQLRTPMALNPGQTFTHHDDHVPHSTVRDHRTGVGRHREVRVTAVVAGGFQIRIRTDAN
jgi:hypothetical protein